MNYFKKTVRLTAVALILASAISLFSACDNGKNDTYEKEFPDVNELEYNVADYLKAPNLKDIVIRKKQIDDSVNYALVSILLRKAERTTYKDADSAEVMLYDTANITFTGVPADENVKLDDSILASMSNASSKLGSNLVIGSGNFIGEYYSDDPAKNNKGFEEQLIGTKVGSTKDILVTFPDEYNVEELCGLVVRFTVTINSISRPALGELTDEECKASTSFETVDAYREYLEEYYAGNYAYASVYSKCEITSECKVLIDMYIDRYIHDNVIYSYGKDLTQKEYDEAYEDLYSKMYDKAREWAVGVTNERIILEYFFGACNITLSDTEFEEAFSKDWEQNKANYEKKYGITTKEEALELLGKKELELSYKYEKLLKVLPEFITVVE